ncbi:glycosyltransferase 52 family protein [Vibrio cortegadensis]|uniref:glycosyltransferase 52 family protein n=1 Tax=Vibrio cortegadensis TaxID=1328770 RepID=UPI00352C3181
MNLFLVTSPLQYICALEAKQYFSSNNNILLLVNQKSQHGLDQQRKIVNFSDWDHVITMERGNRSFSVPKAIKKIKYHLNNQSLQTFYYAEYNAWWTKLLIKNLPIEKEVYFDDGTLTLLEYYRYILPNIDFFRPRIIQDTVVRLNGCQPIGRLSQSKNLEIFTLFTLEQKHISIHNNKLDSLKQRYGHPELYNSEAPVGFIGQGAVGDKNEKSIKEYLNELSALANQSGQKIIYFPHRTERLEVKKALKKAKYIIYRSSELPLEIELIDKKIQLSALVGTFSTAMFTCRLLYPDMPIFTLSNKNPDKAFQEELRKQMNSINVKDFELYSSL